MVTGDQLAIAIETSRRLGLGTNIMEGKELMASKTLGSELMTQVNQVKSCFSQPGEAKFLSPSGESIFQLTMRGHLSITPTAHTILFTQHCVSLAVS
jgi:hypothetical protein